MKTLTLSVINLDQLQHAISGRHSFDCAGGTIGSDGTTWQINDRDHSVAPLHCEIRWIEGGFCALDRCGRTYLNDNSQSLGPLTARRLLEGDRLRIGGYWLRVQFAQADARSLGYLLSAEQSTLDHWLLDAPAEPWERSAAATPLAADICSMFEPGIGNDPLAAFDAAQHTALERLIAGEHS
ncbi:FHA domain-containing protein [Pseudomonas sp. S36]|uniref:FHA domain-containing protein n=1 Tax=Pseudomonas sp. S36 TaxID=2767447 RepID=UPI00191353CC|nr:FHA domain-containing protein [Pseudomonas sp. S36]MBK4987758.1 FHA domain-containing protein [Pseudomonas sp. S36]